MVQTMTITAEQIKQLRERAGAGIMDAKQALTQAGGDMEKALEWLRLAGKASAAKKASRQTGQGVIASYVHSNQRVAVLVSLLCETDFVARTEKFQELARNLALHIAAADPLVVRPEEVPAEEVAKEEAIARQQAEGTGKPAEVQAKMVEGKLAKFRAERALLMQSYVKDPTRTVGELIDASIGELGENITVGGFSRLAI